MKAFLLPVTIALAAALLGGCASSDAPPASATRTSFMELPFDPRLLADPNRDWTDYVEPGDSREAVLTRLGRPDRAVGDELWVYYHTYPDAKSAEADGFDTLVVAFSANRVIGLKIVNAETLHAALATRAPARAVQLAESDR